MADLILLQGEGPNEKSFWESLLQKQGFFPIEEKFKGVFISKSSGHVVMICPCMGMPNINGKSSLQQKSKYQTLPVTVKSSIRALGLTIEKQKLVITFDTETHKADPEERKEVIKKVAGNCFECMGEVVVIPVIGAIENWYIAGLTENISVKKDKISDFNKLVNDGTPDQIESAKDKFYNCFENPLETTLISRKVGNVFDINLARDLSPSFREMYDELNKSEDFFTN